MNNIPKQSKNFTKDYSAKANENQSEITTNWYTTQKNRLEQAQLYSKQKTISMLSEDDNWKKYLGKSGNRKMQKDDISLFKSVQHYGIEYHDKLKTKSFSAHLFILGFCGGDIPRKYYCKCGSKITWDAATQQFKEKAYCGKCRIMPNKREHFMYTYGNDWRKHYLEYHRRMEFTI
jgi:hypothetical protein